MCIQHLGGTCWSSTLMLLHYRKVGFNSRCYENCRILIRGAQRQRKKCFFKRSVYEFLKIGWWRYQFLKVSCQNQPHFWKLHEKLVVPFLCFIILWHNLQWKNNLFWHVVDYVNKLEFKSGGVGWGGICYKNDEKLGKIKILFYQVKEFLIEP